MPLRLCAVTMLSQIAFYGACFVAGSASYRIGRMLRRRVSRAAKLWDKTGANNREHRL
jgi:hypothetical protein